MKKLLYVCLTVLVICALLPSCEKVEEEIPLYTAAPNELILYEKALNHLVIYDTETFAYRRFIEMNNYFQFEFNEASPYYTSGHSIQNGFSILEVQEDSIVQLLTIPKKTQAVFPLAQEGDQLFFVRADYDKNSYVFKRNSIVRYQDGSLIEYKKTKTEHNIPSGVLLNGYLYYTAWFNDRNAHDLYRIPVAEPDAEPECVRQNLEDKEIYRVQGELWVSSPEEIYHDDQKIPKKEKNYFLNAYGLVVQMFQNDQGDTQLTVSTVQPYRQLLYVPFALDFKVEEDILTIYGTTGIQTYHLNEVLG